MSETKSCIDCGQEFELSDGEIKFLEEKGFTMPKRCKTCRAAKRVKMANRNLEHGNG